MPELPPRGAPAGSEREFSIRLGDRLWVRYAELARPRDGLAGPRENTTTIAIQIFDRESGEVTRTETMESVRGDRSVIDVAGRHYASKVDNEVYGVRLVEVTTTTLATY